MSTREEDVPCRVFDVQRFSIHDGPGIRTTVFLEGCALRCAWCHNPEAFGGSVASRVMSSREVLDLVMKDADYYRVSGGGLTLSGGEPLLHAAPARALLLLAKARGLHTCVQTSGAVPRENLEAALGLVDLFQLDLKHMDSERHRSLTGAGNERVHESAAFLLARGANVELRMPLVPGVNDDAAHLARVARFLERHGVRALSLVPYHRLYEGKYVSLGLSARLSGTPAASPEDVRRASALLRREGVAVSVAG